MDSRTLRHGPHVAGYSLAEWLIWNWWRLRWEIGHSSDEYSRRHWAFAHRLTTVGEGYAWPNITIRSDGMNSFLSSEPSRRRDGVLFQYLGSAKSEMVPAVELEEAIDGFVEGILVRLDDRAFAAEFLSPFASVADMLAGDYSEEKQNDVAAHFNVSPMTIRTQLVNHGHLGLDDAPDISDRSADW